MKSAVQHDDLIRHIDQISRHKDRDWAKANFRNVVRELIEINDAKSVLEVGGGRYPAFKQADVEALGVRYTVSDILQSELDLAPDWADKFVFDITTKDPSEIASHRGRYDVAFSKWVMEHVSDYRLAYSNIHSILANGGIYIAWHPVLFSAPFVLNRLIPEQWSSRLLRLAFSHRNDDQLPKFPAHYSGTRISQKVRDNIKAIGFRDVWQLPFYGHGYYEPIPVVRNVHRMATKVIRQADAVTFASFAFTIVRK
jgi:SAM-dependent methyltransferase